MENFSDIAPLRLQPGGLWIDFEHSCDITVKISGQNFECQRCILVPRCKFFKRLCKSVEKPRHMFVEIEGFPGGSEAFQTILSFCYGREVTLSADTKFLCLSYGVSFLGMRRSVMFNTDNLQEICDRFWKDHMLGSCKSIFDTLALLEQTRVMLPKSQNSAYLHQCVKALCLVMKESTNRTELDQFMQKLLMLPEDHLSIMIAGLKLDWPLCKRDNILDSFILAAKKVGSEKFNALGLLSKCLVECKLDEEHNKENEEELKGKRGLQRFSILKDAHPITYVLILIDCIPVKDEETINLRRKLFYILQPQDLGVSCPQSALHLLQNFIEEEFQVQQPGVQTGINLMLNYLRYCKKFLTSLPFKTFLQFARALSFALRETHNELYDEVQRYKKEECLTEEEKKDLEELVNCATLSSDRLKEVLGSKFYCCLQEVVLALKRENEHLKTQLRKRRHSNSDSCSQHGNQLPSKFSRSLEETEEGEVSNLSEERIQERNILQVILNTDNEYEEKPITTMVSSDLSKYTYISIMTSDHMSISFSVELSNTVYQIEKKVLKQMELNALSIPSKWYLAFKGKRMPNESTLEENVIEPYDMLHMIKSWFK